MRIGMRAGPGAARTWRPGGGTRGGGQAAVSAVGADIQDASEAYLA